MNDVEQGVFNIRDEMRSEICNCNTSDELLQRRQVEESMNDKYK